MKNKAILISLLCAPILLGCGNDQSSSVVSSSEIEPSSEASSSEIVSSSELSSSSETSSSIVESSSSSQATFNSPEGEYKDFKLYAGGLPSESSDKYVATVNKTIVLSQSGKLQKGTLSLEVTPTVSSDTGIIFNVDRGSEKYFWEDDVSYYYYFISQAGSAYLGKVEEGNWIICNEFAIKGFLTSKTYKLTVSLDATNSAKTEVNCFLDDEFVFAYHDDTPITEYEFGIRYVTAGSKTSSLTLSNEFKEEVINMFEGYTVASGKIKMSTNDLYQTTSANTLIFNKTEVGYGSFETKMKLLGSLGCNGIVFGLDNNNQNTFWEGGISYYFFFLDEGGVARLAKVNQGTWTDSAISKTVTGWKNNGEFTLKVERDQQVIRGYVDGTKYIEFVDDTPLMGQYYGLRSQSFGTKFTPMTVVKGEEVNYYTPTDLNVVSGGMVTSNDINFIANENNTVALSKSITMDTGTISANIVENGDRQCGLVFKANDAGDSYYRFTIEGNYAKLTKVVSGVETALTNKLFVTASHTKGSTETMYVSVEGNTIRCYVRGILYAKIVENTILNGNKVGFYSAGKSSMFSSLNYEAEVKHDTCDTLMFGHSYMELWRNWKTDFSDYGDVINAGIGGSIAIQWKDLVEEICDYNASTGVFMIGINDLTKYTNDDGKTWFSAASPAEVGQYVRFILDYIEANCPSMTKLALVSCNRCTAREYANIPADIAALNAIFKQIAQDYSWVYYADIDNAFLKSGSPNSSAFIDDLHPSDASYLIIKQAIDNALGGD